jgi:hypothetical protein
MTGETAMGAAVELTFRHFSGAVVRARATIEGEERPAGDFLTACNVRLNDSELRQVRVAEGAHRDTGYERLDNEILAGRRLHEVTRSVEYPASVSFLYGDEAESAAPYALLRRYQGQPLSAVAAQMLEEEQRAFEVSLLTGLCWLAAAGVAHRSLSPFTVRWDSRERQVQITDFSRCTVFGATRNGTGSPEKAASWHRSDGTAAALVTSRDDMYTAGLLIYYVRSQGDGSRPTSARLTELGLADLEPLFGPPEGRPTARELLASHLGEADPVPRGAGVGARLAEGHSRFEFWWQKKGPGRIFPVDPRDGGTASPHPHPSHPHPAPSLSSPMLPSRGDAQAGLVMREAQVSADRGGRRARRRGNGA